VISKSDNSENPYAVTQGDSLSSPASPVTPSELLGKVAFVFHAGEWAEPQPRLGLRDRLIAALLSRFHLGVRVLVRWQATRQYQENREALGS